MSIAVSNAGRVVFPDPGHTKGEVVAYYERAAARMLVHLAGRPVTIRRYPKGLAGPGFFQKNTPAHYPAWIERIEMPRREGATVHPSVADAEGVAYLANQGALEIHAPTVRAPRLGHPDRLLLDLDPPPGEVALVRRAAHLVREAMEGFGMPTTPVVTGSKGYHLVAPIAPTADMETIATSMQELAALLVARHPDVLTLVFRVAKRGRRVFADWLRNGHGATAVVPYSLRARPGAPVAVPIRWQELDTTAPDAFRLATIDARLAEADPLAELAARAPDPAPFVAAIHAAFEESGLELAVFDRFRS